MKFPLSVYVLLFIAILSSGCVSEYEFFPEKNAKGVIVVSGVISNSPENRRISIRRFSDLDTSSAVIFATGSVFKNDQFVAELIPDSVGNLAFPASFIIEEGASYHVEITTDDHISMKTKPEVIQPIWKADSMSFSIERRVFGTNAGGGPNYEWFVDVFTYVRMPYANEGTRLLRTQMDEVWSVPEVRSPRDPANDILRVCYPREDVTQNSSLVINTSEFVPGDMVPFRIASNMIDKSFLHKHYFNLYLHSITEEAYDYFAAAERLINVEGNIYDEIPAPLTGNVYNTDVDGENVYGFVEFSLADTIRLGIEYNELGRSIFDYCQQNWACSSTALPGSLPPCYCLDCHLVYGFESLYKPPYWED
jgi:hypothetical protein